MAIKLPSDVRKAIKKLVFERADKFGYGSRSRTENGAFINSLVEDPEIGGRLKQYMREETVRTYIKDGVLNAYAKAEVKKKLSNINIETVIRNVYNTEAREVGKLEQTYIMRNDANDVFLIHTGTYLKWETALRKLLEFVASPNTMIAQAKSVNLCLLLTVSNGELTFADQSHLEKALDYIGVKVYFAR